MERTEINIKDIKYIPNYPEDFIVFCKENNLKIPRITSGSGKCLSIMLNHIDKYFTRKTTEQFVKKFNINTKDSIQLFNKHEQRGIQASRERGKYYIKKPYKLSNKHKMRKDFGKELTEEQKIKEIEKIKSTIKHDYIDVPNDSWQLGHKNPESTDNKNTNLVLQPPIQAKYRDYNIFIDTITRMPTIKRLKIMYENGECPFTIEQLKECQLWLNEIL